MKQGNGDLLEGLTGVCNGEPGRIAVVMIMGQAFRDYKAAEANGLIVNGRLVARKLSKGEKKTGGMCGAGDILSAIQLLTTRALERLLTPVDNIISAAYIRRKGNIPLIEA